MAKIVNYTVDEDLSSMSRKIVHNSKRSVCFTEDQKLGYVWQNRKNSMSNNRFQHTKIGSIHACFS